MYGPGLLLGIAAACLIAEAPRIIGWLIVVYVVLIVMRKI